jgi:hypothetical protein
MNGNNGNSRVSTEATKKDFNKIADDVNKLAAHIGSEHDSERRRWGSLMSNVSSIADRQHNRFGLMEMEQSAFRGRSQRSPFRVRAASLLLEPLRVENIAIRSPERCGNQEVAGPQKGNQLRRLFERETQRTTQAQHREPLPHHVLP